MMRTGTRLFAKWWLVPCGLLALLAAPTMAASIYVDSTFIGFSDGTLAAPWTTLQQGVNAGAIGDVVRVAPGTYRETIVMANPVSMICEDPPNCVIDPSGLQNSAVTFSGVTESVRFDGFTIDGGEGDLIGNLGNYQIFAGGAMLIIESSPLITNCVFSNHTIDRDIALGAAIYINVTSGHNPRIEGNLFINNTALSTTVPEECKGGAIYASSKLSTITITENQFDTNVSRVGGAVYLINQGAATATIQRNIFASNVAVDGAALMTPSFTSSSSIIVNNLFLGNGSLEGAKDCDDGTSARSPNQVEICGDGLDNDCDDSTPDLFDADGDGSFCDVDCDDSDPAIHPNAAEHCDDDVDNDCDGSIDFSDPGNITLIEFGSPMLYLANSADPGLGITWADTLFDDSTWTAGNYGVGYEVSAGGANDLIASDVPTDTATVYTRATFEIADINDVTAVFTGADYDDGYVMWINGVEVLRSAEMPGGDPDWDTTAAAHESSNATVPDYGTLIDISSVALPELVDGTNVFAVGIYNDFTGGASSDLVVVPFLTASIGPDDADCLCGDVDGDDYSCTDCMDADPLINPGMVEVCADGVDNDCDVTTLDVTDADADGANCTLDCDDDDPAVNPSAFEVDCDGLDNDCNPATLDVVDADSDFYACDTDCVDGNPAINPGALEFCFDGIDNNCDGFVDSLDAECTCGNPVDLDLDGYRCQDCNDGDPLTNPAANEICNDGKDNDCEVQTPDIFDGDGDGDMCDVDCNDSDASRNSVAIEICNDGIDNDCDGDTDAVDVDCAGCPDDDGDGYPGGVCAVDCEDMDPDVHPGLDEVCDDGKDNDCDVATDDLGDFDGDGVTCDLDCDENDPSANNNAAEKCDDFVDNDCDGDIDVLRPDYTLVQSGYSMTYLANLSDPGVGIDWTLDTFDDSPWFNGLYGVGYEQRLPGTGGAEELIATVVPEGAASVYTRIWFDVVDAGGVNALHFGAEYDDAYVVWVNGVEVLRSVEMPGGTPLWDANPAVHESSNGQVPDYGTLIDISIAGIPALHNGANLLAVGLYNNIPSGGGVSSDLVLVPRLAMDYGADDADCFACPDLDGDGYAGGTCAVDCNDFNSGIHPGAAEIGCDLKDNDCDPGTNDVLDADGDGSDCNVDCDDLEPNAYPGNSEIACDFIDNDCDAFTSDIQDVDNDTFLCTIDCDDENILVNPNATELPCDGIDNDCSTLTSDIQDGDGDGTFCDLDCDDADATRHLLVFEKCDDGVDNNCDALTDIEDLASCDCPDTDGDGYACLDCADGDATIHPAAVELCNDTFDNDCNVATPDIGDADADGSLCTDDCNDDDPFERPGAVEICADGKDNDCDVGTPDIFDEDMDGEMCDVDCNDHDATISSFEVELCDDGIDNDCNTLTPDLFDADADGWLCSFECDDGNFDVNPDQTEICNDGIDNDCNTDTPDLLDEDADGDTCESDCDDMDPLRYNLNVENCVDGIDNDCDGDVDNADSDCAGCPDVDGDGYPAGVCAADCNDDDPNIHPGQPEVCNDTIDNDCDPATLDFDDLDGDSYFCDVDCDDTDPAIHPGQSEVCNDSLDNDCDPGTVDLFDIDMDGHTCEVDCDDGNGSVNTAMVEIGCDALDNDCDPLTSDLADDDADGYTCVDGSVRGGALTVTAAGAGATLTVVNNTFVSNGMPSGIGGGMFVDDLAAGTPGTVANNILYDNEAELGGALVHTAFFGALNNNNFFGNVGGDLYDGGGSGATKSANTFVDPQLATIATGNYRLDESSPLIDAGDPLVAPQNDFDRFARPFDGDDDMTALPDVGAFEYPSGEVFALEFTGTHELSWTEHAGFTSYSLYRGRMSTLKLQGIYVQDPADPDVAQFCGIAPGGLPFVDPYTPPPGGRLFYLVTASQGSSFDGSLGQDSSNALRPNDNPCP